MKTLFVKAVKKGGFDKAKFEELLKVISKEIHITYSIQYYSMAEEVRRELVALGFKIHGFVQVLGCRALKVDSFPILHIGSGKFHATNPNLYRISKDITLFDGFSITKVDSELIKKSELRRHAKIKRYLSSDSVGLLVSNKYGQQDLGSALEFVSMNENARGRKHYFFLCNNINQMEFENFNIDFWVNTACPRIEEDSSEILSLDRLTKMEDLD